VPVTGSGPKVVCAPPVVTSMVATPAGSGKEPHEGQRPVVAEIDWPHRAHAILKLMR